MAIKLFNKWETNITVNDPGLNRYITLKPIIVPKTPGRNSKLQFHKSNYNIVERLINKVMIPGHKGKKHTFTSGHCGGKGARSYLMVKKAFELIENKMNKNPVEVFVKAIENSAPRDEVTSIEYGGARYPQAVECAPQRRVDIVLRMFVQGSYQKSFNKKIKFYEALADEIMKAYQGDAKSSAISKKTELEKQADASR